MGSSPAQGGEDPTRSCGAIARFDGSEDQRIDVESLHRIPVRPANPPVVDAHVPDLARRERRAAVKLSIENQRAADAGAERDANGVLRADRRAVFPLTVSHRVGVVFDDRGQTGAFG